MLVQSAALLTCTAFHPSLSDTIRQIETAAFGLETSPIVESNHDVVGLAKAASCELNTLREERRIDFLSELISETRQALVLEHLPTGLAMPFRMLMKLVSFLEIDLWLSGNLTVEPPRLEELRNWLYEQVLRQLDKYVEPSHLARCDLQSLAALFLVTLGMVMILNTIGGSKSFDLCIAHHLLDDDSATIARTIRALVHHLILVGSKGGLLVTDTEPASVLEHAICNFHLKQSFFEDVTSARAVFNGKDCRKIYVGINHRDCNSELHVQHALLESLRITDADTSAVSWPTPPASTTTFDLYGLLEQRAILESFQTTNSDILATSQASPWASTSTIDNYRLHERLEHLELLQATDR